MGDRIEKLAFNYVPFYTDVLGLVAGTQRELDKKQELGDINVRRTYVHSSCLKISSKKGTPAIMPELFPNRFASAMDSPTTNPP